MQYPRYDGNIKQIESYHDTIIIGCVNLSVRFYVTMECLSEDHVILDLRPSRYIIGPGVGGACGCVGCRGNANIQSTKQRQ